MRTDPAHGFARISKPKDPIQNGYTRVTKPKIKKTQEKDDPWEVVENVADQVQTLASGQSRVPQNLSSGWQSLQSAVSKQKQSDSDKDF